MLARQGKKVTLVEILDAVATDVHSMVRIGLLNELSRHGVKILTGVKIDDISERGVTVIDKRSHKMNIEADTIVLALGYRSPNDFERLVLMQENSGLPRQTLLTLSVQP
ncbi:FAD-dependent oxidoreductase [Chloroflexota bacterium]